MVNKGLWSQMQDDEVPQKGEWDMGILNKMMKGMVSTAPKVLLDDCTIEPYMVNEEGGACWWVRAGDRVIAVSNKAGCEQFMTSMKKLIADG